MRRAVLLAVSLALLAVPAGAQDRLLLPLDEDGRAELRKLLGA